MGLATLGKRAIVYSLIVLINSLKRTVWYLCAIFFLSYHTITIQKLFSKMLLGFSVYGYLHASFSVNYMYICSFRGQKMLLDPRKVEFRTLENCQVGAESGTELFRKSGQCSYLLNHLTSFQK